MHVLSVMTTREILGRQLRSFMGALFGRACVVYALINCDQIRYPGALDKCHKDMNYVGLQLHCKATAKANYLPCYMFKSYLV